MKGLPNSSILGNRRKSNQRASERRGQSKETTRQVEQNKKDTKDWKDGKNGKVTKGAKKNFSRCGGPKQNRKEECKAYDQTSHLRSKPNHFASVCSLNNKPAEGKTVQRGQNSVKQVTEETVTSDDEITDTEDPLFKIEKSPAQRHQASNSIPG